MKKIIAMFAMGLMSIALAQPASYNKCVACHGKDGKSVKLAPKAIASLSKKEIVDMLNGYKNKTIKGPKAAVMYGQAAKLTDAEINELADYISKLK